MIYTTIRFLATSDRPQNLIYAVVTVLHSDSYNNVEKIFSL
jgi:hypothetical protein